MFNQALILLISTLASALNGQSSLPIPEFGNCVDSPVISDFNPGKYVGTWFEIGRQGIFFEEHLKCVNATYKVLNATFVSVDNESINKNTGKREYANGYAFVPDLNKPNHLIVQFPFPSPPAQYNVWKTDYNSYSLVYTCTQLIPNLLKYEFIWILSKQLKLDPSIVQDLKSILEKSGVNISKFETPDYTNC